MRVDVGGRDLFLDFGGEGEPVLVFEAGSGCSSEIWDPIWPGVQQFSRVVRYDRANLGQSAAAPTPRTARQAVIDLHTALVSAGLTGPFVLVGHSFGGLLVRLYAHWYPEEVAGLVLVDSSHHEQNERYLPLLPAESSTEHHEITTLRRLSLDPRAANSEGMMVGATQLEAGRTGSLGDLPLLVISRALPENPAIIAKRRPGYPPDVASALEHLWVGLQEDLVRLSTRSTQVVVPESHHFVHHDQPDLVVEAIAAFIKRVR